MALVSARCNLPPVLLGMAQPTLLATLPLIQSWVLDYAVDGCGHMHWMRYPP